MSGCFRRQNSTGSTGRSKKLKTHGRPIEKNNGQSKTGRPQEKNSGESKTGRPQEKSSGESKTGRPQEKSSGQRLTGRITDQKMHGPWEKEEQEELVEENKVTSAVAAVVFLVVSIIVQHQLKICSGIGYHSSIETYACHCCMYWSAAFYMYLCIYLPLTHLCNGCCLHIWIVSDTFNLDSQSIPAQQWMQLGQEVFHVMPWK